MKLIIHFFMPDNIFTFNHFNTKPMLLNHKAIVGFLLFLFFLWSCSKKDSPPPDPCLGVSYD
ncbi:MAG TPA: hypothetical protein PKG90_13335, partial [Chitinophagaceae bacterium]|nr:hypothetical protein [Chitinophagaceae bacterium]